MGYNIKYSNLPERKIDLEKAKIDRINELAKKKKTCGLTQRETEEQAALRREYLKSIRADFKATLDSIEYSKE